MPDENPQETAKLKKIIPEPEWTPSFWKVSQLPSLSLRALGLHTYLMSLPEGWDISSDRISRQRKEGRDAVRNALNELKEAGLFESKKYQGEDGKIRTTTEVRAIPGAGATSGNNAKAQVKPATENQAPVNQAPVNQAPKKRDTKRETLDKDKDKSISSEIASRSTDLVPRRDDVESLCTLLADRIEANGSKRPNITDKWRDAARLMLDRDGRTFQQIQAAILWCQNHEFWKANILSMPKLREKYDQLRLVAQREGAGNGSQINVQRRNGDLGTEAHYARYLERAASREAEEAAGVAPANLWDRMLTMGGAA